MIPARDGPIILVLTCLLIPGCSSIPGGMVEHHVSVINNDGSTHEVHVTIMEGDSTVLDETSTVGSGGGRWDVTALDDAGDYEVVVQTDDGAGMNESYTLPLAEGGRESFLDISIQEDGSLTGNLYWQD